MKERIKRSILIGILLALLTFLGLFVHWFNNATRLETLGQSPLAGHLEVIVILFGLTIVGSGGVFGIARLWKGQPKSFMYDIGLRFVAMGFLVSFISGLADYIGIGAHHKLPYFGPIQTAGVLLGEVVIASGFLLMIPWIKHEK